MGLLGKDKELADAAEQGNLKLVMEHAKFWGNPKFNRSEALRRAAMEGHTDVVAFLIPLSDPNVERGFALKTSAVRGYTQCVRLLLECTELHTQSMDNMTVGMHALYCATTNAYYDIVDLIFEQINNEDVATVVKHLSDDEEHFNYLRNKLMARAQKQILEAEVGALGVAVQRKI